MEAATAPVVTPPPLSPRRQQILEAAVRVVGEQGLRGLTHRAVDRQAGIPEGSCSAYLRTRKALLMALTEYVSGSLTADVAELAGDLDRCADTDQSQQRAVELTTGLFLRWLEEPELLSAKLELTMEASRDRDLAGLLVQHRSQLVTLVGGILRDRGKDDTVELAEAMVASYDGILAAALLKPVELRQGFLERSLALVLAALTGE